MTAPILRFRSEEERRRVVAAEEKAQQDTDYQGRNWEDLSLYDKTIAALTSYRALFRQP